MTIVGKCTAAQPHDKGVIVLCGAATRPVFCRVAPPQMTFRSGTY
jgi:hypothetical protein